MSFIALKDNTTIYSYDLSIDEFEDTRSYKLSCPYCMVKLIPRSSGDGRITQHFYHMDKNACNIENMSIKHLELQRRIANVINEQDGWNARKEFSGNGWRADVVAINIKTSKKYSFEIQLSSMTEDSALERDRRHKAGGIDQVIWVCGKKYPWASKVASASVETAGWNIDHDPDVSCRLLIVGAKKSNPLVKDLTISLSRFIQGLVRNKAVPVHVDSLAVEQSNAYVVREYDGVVFEEIYHIASIRNQQLLQEIHDDERALIQRERNIDMLNKRLEAVRQQRRIAIEKARDSIASECERQCPELLFNSGDRAIAYASHAFHYGKMIVIDPIVQYLDISWCKTLFEPGTLIIMSNETAVAKVKLLEGMKAKIVHASWLAEPGTLRNYLSTSIDWRV